MMGITRRNFLALLALAPFAMINSSRGGSNSRLSLSSFNITFPAWLFEEESKDTTGIQAVALEQDRHTDRVVVVFSGNRQVTFDAGSSVKSFMASKRSLRETMLLKRIVSYGLDAFYSMIEPIRHPESDTSIRASFDAFQSEETIDSITIGSMYSLLSTLSNVQTVSAISWESRTQRFEVREEPSRDVNVSETPTGEARIPSWGLITAALALAAMIAGLDFRRGSVQWFRSKAHGLWQKVRGVPGSFAAMWSYLWALPLRILTTLFAVTSLAVLSLFPLTVSLFALGRVADSTSPSAMLYIGVVIVGAGACALSAVTLQRSAMRIAPLRLDRRRPGLGLWLLWLVPLLLVALALLMERVAQVNVPTPLAGVTPLPTAVQLFWFAVPLAFLFAAYRGVWFVTRLHSDPDLLLERPFVLFLRRFSSFTDRVGVEGILKSLPPGVPLVFLVPRPSSARDWNPWMIGLAGMRPGRLRSGYPVFLSADHGAWQASVDKLVQSAKLIVMDGSESSQALDWELSTLARYERVGDTIFLREEGADKGLATARDQSVIEY